MRNTKKCIAILLVLLFAYSFSGCFLKREKEINKLLDYVTEKTTGDQKFAWSKEDKKSDPPMISIFFSDADQLDEKHEIISSVNSFFESNPDYYLIEKGYLINLYFDSSESGSKACNYELANKNDLKEGPEDRIISLDLVQDSEFRSDCNEMFESIKYLQIPWSTIEECSKLDHFPSLKQVVIKTNQNINAMIKKLNSIYPDIKFLTEEEYMKEMTMLG